jgi:hypothetical protein
MWSGSVVATPGTGSAGSKDGCGKAETDAETDPDTAVVDEAVPLAGIAAPPVVFSQPTTTPATRHAHPRTSHTHLAGGSVARKGKREFHFDIHIGPAGKVDGDLGDGAAGERERRLVAA